MIEGIINHDKTVMNTLSLSDINWSVLVIMPFYIKLQLVVYPLGIDCSQNSTTSFVKKRQYCFINVIVN